ncbi:unnamed protein product [Ilex paraguariensis]|uniref:NAC domain-containing protein n=1 Tax=Ilex paraguariensis TaxID=185542 RepID=A0ABC8SVA7_9AQUA
MENFTGILKEDDEMELPPGFRFHPMDEELITHYLAKKVFDSHFSARAMGEVDMNKVEPWELPWKAKMGEKEWYFFCLRDKKYPTGLRTNRATAAGYWKATGKDREIFRGKTLVGMKKTLVFYMGRAPKGEKTNWVSHEYRLEGKFSLHNLPKTAKNDWVICRVFHKNSGEKKVHISGLERLNSVENEPVSPALPPLTDTSYGGRTKPTLPEFVHVPCFSSSIAAQKNQEDTINYLRNSLFPLSSNPSNIFPRFSLPNSFSLGRSAPVLENFQYPGSIPLQDQGIMRNSLQNYGPNMKQSFKTEEDHMVSVSHEIGLSTEMNFELSSVVSNLEMARKSFDNQEAPSTSGGPQDLDYLWSYRNPC